MRLQSGLKSMEELLAEYRSAERPADPRKLRFLGVDGYDVYNTTAPFSCEGDIYIAGRVERRENEISHVRIFRKVAPDTYKAVLPEKVFTRLQDPFITKIGDELVLGGVQIDTDPLEDTRIIMYRTLFFRGRTPADFRLFASGPNFMKDIRLIELPDGVGVFTRPNGVIGFTRIASLDELNSDVISGAPLLKDQFPEGCWGGCNEIHRLNNGLLGILGHIAYRTPGVPPHMDLHYQSMRFVFDPETFTYSGLKIIARREDFLPGSAKRNELKDVLFSSGLQRLGGGRALLYTGVSDAEEGYAELPDPFAEFEAED